MDLVLLHYHLNRGGVTRVIENHLLALAAHGMDSSQLRVCILYGGEALAWNEELTGKLPFEVELAPIPELGYDRGTPPSVERITQGFADALATRSRESTVIHVHNHNLGKNAHFHRALNQLAVEGWRLLLQIHDFAEDLRPQNYQHLVQHSPSVQELQASLYPQANQIHYAVLNRRDREILTIAGFPTDRLHYLPNAAPNPETVANRASARALLSQRCRVDPDRAYVLYPVRAIRRKNLGEILVWAILADAEFGVTLAPLNPIERSAYERWESQIERLGLDIHLGVGDSGLTLQQNYAAADAIVTTSVAEGFGLVFLEATLAQRRLVGRDLPGVTGDFRDAGMRFPGLYDSLSIPSDAVDLAEMKARYLAMCQDLRSAFQMPAYDSPQLTATVDQMFDSPTIDFARCDRRTQHQFIERLNSDTELQQTVRALNSHVRHIAIQTDDTNNNETITTNREVIARHYSLNVIGHRLNDIYDQLLATPSDAPSQCGQIGRSILDQFVLPGELYPVRVES